MISPWARSVFSLELRKQMVSRVDLLNNLVGHGLTYFAVAYFFWKSVFELSGQSHMAGMTFQKMLLYQTLVPFIERIARGMDYPETADEIYDGSLSRFVLYPIHFLNYKLAQRAARTFYGLLQGCLAIGIFLFLLGQPEGVQFSVGSISMFLGTVLLIAMLDFFMSISVQCVAFWADNVWSLHVMYRFICVFLGGGYLPLALFPESVAEGLRFLPFWYLVEFPLRTLMGEYSFLVWLNQLPLLLGWLLVTGMLMNLIWRRGQNAYTGVGL